MAQISIDTLHSEGVIFIVDVVNMLSRIDYVQLSLISICAVIFCLGSSIYHSLNRLGCLILTYNMPHYLPGFSTHHRHDVDVFPSSCPWFVLQVPVQLIHFQNVHNCCGFFFSRPLTALFYQIHDIGFVHSQNFSHPHFGHLFHASLVCFLIVFYDSIISLFGTLPSKAAPSLVAG